MPLRNIFFYTGLLVACVDISAQTTSTLLHYADSVFYATKGNNAPGIAITIIENGSVVSRKDFGMANLEHKVPFNHETPVRLGYSGAREFMCAGLAIMVEEGFLSFDDKVRTYFPKLPGWSENVTVRDLLNHSSGFDDEWATMLLMQADMDNRVDKEQLLTMLYDQPQPQVEPGKGYMYSNSDFALLRWIMEIASKQSLPDYLKQKLFEPLGMRSTFMNDFLDQLIPGLADHYYGQKNYFKRLSVKTSPGGNYRIVTTASDLEKWALALEDSNSIASKAFRKLYAISRPIPVLSPERHYLFGHEWHLIEGIDIIKHGGVNHDFYMTRIPSKQVSIIGLGNSFDNMARAMGIAGLMLNPNPSRKSKQGDAPTASDKPITVSHEKLASYNGRYIQNSKPGHSSLLPNIQFYDLKTKGDSLYFFYSGDQSFSLVPIGQDLFKDPDYGTIIQIKKDHPDSTMKMRIWLTDGSEPMIFSRINLSGNISEEYLRQFTGQYYSRHLDFYCRILVNDDKKLIIRRPTIIDKQMIPYGDSQFVFEMEAGEGGWYVLAKFTKNTKGEIDGIDMQHVRMMHHRFDKIK